MIRYAMDSDAMSVYREMAANCWCDPRTEHHEMIPALAEVFAERLYLNTENARRLAVGSMPVQIEPCDQCRGMGKVPPMGMVRPAEIKPDGTHVIDLVQCYHCEGTGRQFVEILPLIHATRPVDDSDIYPDNGPDDPTNHGEGVEFVPSRDAEPGCRHRPVPCPTVREMEEAIRGTAAEPPVGEGFTAALTNDYSRVNALNPPG